MPCCAFLIVTAERELLADSTLDENMSAFFRSALVVLKASGQVIATLFPIVNPIGSAAVFSAMVQRFDGFLQRRLAKKIAVYSFFLLFVSMLCGGQLLAFFGVSLYSVQIGGGLVVVINSWLLLAKDSTDDPNVPLSPDAILMRAFYPFTLPFTVGPGSISVAVALGAHLPAELNLKTAFFSPLLVISAALGAVVICVVVYLCYCWAQPAEHLLGATGTTVTIRLSSFISLCIGVQIISSGVRGYISSIH